MALGDDIAPNLPRWHLAIGECIFTLRPAVINTVLGSCVAVTFHHAPSCMAAIFHALLPHCDNKPDARNQPCKYVTSATRQIMERFQAERVPFEEITAKLFGGAYSMGNRACSKTRAMIDVGAQNVAMAEQELKLYGLRISSRDTHGAQGRKLFFDTSTGDVWLRSLAKVSPQALRQAVAHVHQAPLPLFDQSTFVIK